MSLGQLQFGEPFYIGITDSQTGTMNENNTMIMAKYLSEPLALMVAECQKHQSPPGVVYYCIPVGETDGAHTKMLDQFEILSRAAAAIDGGGDATLERHAYGG